MGNKLKLSLVLTVVTYIFSGTIRDANGLKCIFCETDKSGNADPNSPPCTKPLQIELKEFAACLTTNGTRNGQTYIQKAGVNLQTLKCFGAGKCYDAATFPQKLSECFNVPVPKIPYEAKGKVCFCTGDNCNSFKKKGGAAAKKPAVKKPAVKKTGGKKTAVKKAPVKKTAAKKPAVKKTAVKKTAGT